VNTHAGIECDPLAIREAMTLKEVSTRMPSCAQQNDELSSWAIVVKRYWFNDAG
jgi:hypothetical protein